MQHVMYLVTCKFQSENVITNVQSEGDLLQQVTKSNMMNYQHGVKKERMFISYTLHCNK